MERRVDEPERERERARGGLSFIPDGGAESGASRDEREVVERHGAAEHVLEQRPVERRAHELAVEQRLGEQPPREQQQPRGAGRAVRLGRARVELRGGAGGWCRVGREPRLVLVVVLVYY